MNLVKIQKHYIAYGALTVLLIGALIWFFLPIVSSPPVVKNSPPTVASSTISINDTERVTEDPLPIPALEFEIVRTQEEQARGLSGRTDVPQNYGMLFVFPYASQWGFWMKDMLVPIDIIWLADNGTILKIDENVLPSTYVSNTDASLYYPPRAVRLVLETRAFEAQRRGWGVGTRIELPTGI